MVELREHDSRILLSTANLGGIADVEQLIKASSLQDSAVMRALITLQEKGLVKIHEHKQTALKLNEEGKRDAAEGLPERRLINAIEKLGGKAKRSTAFQEARLGDQFASIALGWAQKKKWTTFDPKTDMLQTITKPELGNDEKLLQLLNEKEKVTAEDVDPQLQQAIQTIKGRKLVNVELKTKRTIELTQAGRETLKEGVKKTAEVTQLTQELIISGKWKKLKLQKYNVEASVAQIWPGKKHPYLQFLQEVRHKLVTLGFKEMVGTAVETAFFNFDILYTPQDHPAREASGIYYVKSPREGSIQVPKKTLANIKETHENGWKTCSTGWKYKYSIKEAKRLILRGHGTCLSARTLLSKDLKVPGRYFSIARCYRPEIVDKTHLTEFNQVEGIIIDKDLTLRDLLGILEKFALEIAGADYVKFRPDYFPFTEPSVELAAYKKGYGWVEFGGSGIFRPEVTLPLGIKEPVIAWGLGIDRLFMMKAKIEEIRYIFTQDLDWIRKKAVI